MEEVIEQLREANEPVPVPLELPDEDQLVEIEEQLFIDIPFVFREFLLTVSDVVYGSLEPVTVTDPQSHTYLPDVAANAWDAGVDRSMIPICQDGDDYYCVEEDGTVVLWSGEEELVTEETWESVWHWARDVCWKAETPVCRGRLLWRASLLALGCEAALCDPLSAPAYPYGYPGSPARRPASAYARG